MHFFPIVCTFSTVTRLHSHRVSAMSIDERSSSFVPYVPAHIIPPSSSAMNSKRGRKISWIRDADIDLRARASRHYLFRSSFVITHFTVPSVLDFARRRLHLIKTHGSGACFRDRIGINKSYTVTRISGNRHFTRLHL